MEAIHHDSDGTRFEFDATIDGLVDASSSGVGDNPQRLRELASVAWATADELGEARARQRHPGREWADCLTDSRQRSPAQIGRGSVMSLSPALAGGVFPHPLNPRPATRGRSRGGVPDQDLLVRLGSSGLGSSEL